MDRARAERVLAMFEKRGQVEALESAGSSTARACLDRAGNRLRSAELLFGAGHWESAFIASYDAYRTSAEAVVLALGHRVPAVAGAHRITVDIAQAAVGSEVDVFAGAAAERFRTGRHEAEYFDPDHPAVKTEADARWAIEKATGAIAAVTAALG